jgi:hypothetical protein
MLRLTAVVAMVLASGCAFDAYRNDRPARLRVGTNARRFTAPAPPATPGALRTASSQEMQDAGGLDGVTGSAQFTMASRSKYFYAGGELEAGMLASSGSNVAGAYLIGGAQHVARYGSLALEVAGGWRALRYSLNDADASALVAEPRLRGELWVSPRFALGATAGATLGEQGAWMAGVYLGIHSHLFGSLPID